MGITESRKNGFLRAMWDFIISNLSKPMEVALKLLSAKSRIINLPILSIFRRLLFSSQSTQRFVATLTSITSSTGC